MSKHPFEHSPYDYLTHNWEKGKRQKLDKGNKMSTEHLKHYPELVAWIEQECNHKLEDVSSIKFVRDLGDRYTVDGVSWHYLPVGSANIEITFTDGTVALRDKPVSFVVELKEPVDPRKTQFAGWASAVWKEMQEIGKGTYVDANGFTRAMLAVEVEQVYVNILARAGYALVKHTVAQSYEPEHVIEITRSTPDLPELPEE